MPLSDDSTHFIVLMCIQYCT